MRFKKEDRVVVKHQYKIPFDWDDEMAECCGELGRVVDVVAVCGDKLIKVHIPKLDIVWMFLEEELEMLDDEI